MDNIFLFFVIIFCVTNTSSLYADGPNRILDGWPVNDDVFPYMISLQRLSEIHSDTRGHRCGGVLVTLQHALTAAQCTVDYDSGQMIPIHRDEYRVFGGGASFLPNDTSADRVRRIANIVIHPEYNATIDRFLNNIAVVILGTPFLSNTATRLPIRDIGTTSREGCLIIGWGRKTILTFNEMTAHNESMCHLYMGTPLSPTMICGWSPGSAGCPGDEGGPLVCIGSLVGLIVDTRGCETSPAGVHLYLRVSYYTAWIDSVVVRPIPELGPEPPTVPPPTTTTIPAPGAASTFQPGMSVLAVIVVTQLIIANLMN